MDDNQRVPIYVTNMRECEHNPNDLGNVVARGLARHLNRPLACGRCGYIIWDPEWEKQQTRPPLWTRLLRALSKMLAGENHPM